MGLSSLLFTLKSIKQFINKDIALKAAWLSPAILLFSGSRFDIYPVLFFVLSLINLKKDRLFISAIYLGISICLKGYAIFILPSCFYYISVNYLPALPSVSAIFFSLIGFLRKPRNFDEFADSCVLATTGFSSSLVFYSPQFCLWTLSCSTFSKNRKITFLTLCFCFTTYIYYPLAGVYYAYGTRNDTYSFFIYSASIILVTITRILLIFFTIVKSKKNKSFKYKF